MTPSHPARVRSPRLWAATAVALSLAVGACTSGSKSPTVPHAGAGPTTTADPAGGSSPSSTAKATTALEKAQAYAQCMRSHGVQNFPDPVSTPSGDYGFRTQGID